jgi:paraquat-inducible protein B
MDALRLLLEELCTHIMDHPFSSIIQRMESPLAHFQTTMEQFTQKLRPGDGVLSKFSKQLKWTLWSKKEANQYLGKFEQFNSLLNGRLSLDLW